MSRASGRAPDELRTLQIIPNTMPFAEGSASIRLGDTHVLCAATVDERVPSWMRGQGKGWVTAEYSMLPRSTKERTPREAVSGKQGGRTVEIQRLIGRSLRAGVDLKLLGERQVIVDCDVVRADGGTRCAAITGGYVALAIAINALRRQGRLNRDPLSDGDRRGECWHRARRASSRSRLRRGQRRGGRLQYRRHGRWGVRRDPGHRGRQTVRSAKSRRAARSRESGSRRALRGSARGHSRRGALLNL